MDLDRFLKSQTFKTGVFVLLVLFVFLLVFKIGFIHGYKKAISPHKYGTNYSHQIQKGTYFGNHSEMFNKDIHSKLLFKKKFIEGKVMLDFETDKEPEAE